jgi:hypothetical protein
MQDRSAVEGSEAVLWIENGDRADPAKPIKVIAYFEGNSAQPVLVDYQRLRADDSDAEFAGRQETPHWLGRFYTSGQLQIDAATSGATPEVLPPIYRRGLEKFKSEEGSAASAPADGKVQPAQFTTTIPPGAAPQPAPVGFRRVQIFRRSDAGFQAETLQTPEGENVLVISGGVNVVIRGLAVEGIPNALGPLGDVDIETDRAVIWTRGLEGGLGQLTQQHDAPLEIYMEGNIVFRQGDRTVYADRMFYDVRRRVGVILNAELLTPLPEFNGNSYQGLVRLKAAALQQLDESRFVAHDAFVTTSRLEEPSYHFASETITFSDVQLPSVDPFTGMPGIDPLTGEPQVAHQQLAESQNNFLYVGGVPVFYWPTIATDLEKPSYYVDNIHVGNDSIFGTQVMLELDAYQLLGMRNPPEGTEWDINLDYLSKRGMGFGTTVDYTRDSFFNLPGATDGWADAWFIDDDGVDNLGRNRRHIVPEERFRGRALWNHRQHLVGGLFDDWIAQAEVGWISDRTFLEQYYEREWDERKDEITGVRLKRLYDNQAFSMEANVRVNDFFTQTQWLPRVDHYWLGESLLGDTLTWYEHSSAAYANIGVASTPTNPTLASQFELFPWETDSAGVRISGKGERLATRHEFDVPLDFAPFKVVPYILGEAAHWGEDLEGNDIQRLYIQPGVRASIPFWSVNPTVRDPLFNLNGLAHKVVFEAEAFYADADQNLDEFPLYDPLDDDSLEDMRRRLFFSPFGQGLAGIYYIPGVPSTIDAKFDPRYYALRSGMQGWVTAPSTEIVDDLALVRMGMRNRLQTKRGPIGEQHIVDWLTLDTNITWFPEADRDNFGQEMGLADYYMEWHVGDRFSILSDGAADFFGDGLRTASLGGRLNHPSQGNLYLGFRTIDGPFKSNVVTAKVNYRSTPKWVLSASTAVDVSDYGNIGQTFTVSRIGESLIASVGASVDSSKDNVGVMFLVEPRFLPNLNLTRKSGLEIPPAGAYGLE